MNAAPRERPIPFINEMVLAILAGRKTETRRLIRGLAAGPGVRPAWPSAEVVRRRTGTDYGWLGQRDGTWRMVGPVGVVKELMALPASAPQPKIRSPYQPGDLLWVRERVTRSGGLVRYLADGKTPGTPGRRTGRTTRRPRGSCRSGFARIWLRALEVRVERLQEITEKSYFAEGLRIPPVEETVGHGGDLMIDVTGWWKTAFAGAWNRLNGDRAPWKSNPWVWVIRFEVVEGGRNVKGEQG